MKFIGLSILFLLTLIMCVPLSINAQDIYSYGDTLKPTINLSSGYYNLVDDVDWYIYGVQMMQ